MGGWVSLRNAMSIWKKGGLAKEGDHEAATEYPEYLENLMEENGYFPEQIFKAVLFWKYVPTCTSVEKDEKKPSSFKPRKDKLKDLFVVTLY